MADVIVRAPNAEIVFEAFVGGILGSLDLIATSLPKDQSKWVENGFVTYTSLPSGVPDVDLPIHDTVMELHAFATNGVAGSTAPPWGKAFDLASRIAKATQAVRINSRPFPTKPNYGHARVIEAVPLSDPQRVPLSPAGFADVTFDLHIRWVEVS